MSVLEAALDRAYEGGNTAVLLLDDPGNALVDDEATQRAQLASYCDAVVAAMLTAAASDDPELQRVREITERALAALDPTAATLVRELYREGRTWRSLVDAEGPGPARRRHDAALTALGRALVNAVAG